VEFLLRRPLNSDADIQFALASAEAGLIFMDEVPSLSSLCLCLSLPLSWLLSAARHSFSTQSCSQVPQHAPRCTLTMAASLRQQYSHHSNFSSVVDHMPEELRGKLTEKQDYLVSGLNGVRQLIRVKIADDNDLELARDSLQSAADFLKRLTTEAEKAGDSPFEILRSRP
jgi:hypothetical protein